MAQWRGACRSNYFKVKDPAAFRKLVAEFGATLLEKDGAYGFSADDVGSRPRLSGACPEEHRKLYLEIHHHLAADQICIIMEIGSSKLQYLTGWAKAIHPDGQMITLDLDEIYALALAKFGDHLTMTAVEY